MSDPDVLLIATPDRDNDALAAGLRKHLPGAEIRVWPDCGDPDEIAFVLAWRAPEALFSSLPGLRAVSSLGAGVDELIDRDDIADSVEIGRLAGTRLASDMAAYLVAVVVHHWRGFDRLRELQQRAEWQPRAPAGPPVVGLLGVGSMGRKTAAAFRALEIPMHGWSRSGAVPEGVTPARGRSGLKKLAERCDALINLLPLTRETRGVLDASLFEAMRRDSLLVNVGRGGHLVESDLLAALDAGRPGRAVLDVFDQEPLPADHPFWRHPGITVTPHCASITSVDEAAELAAESYRRVMAGGPPLGRVERERGY